MSVAGYVNRFRRVMVLGMHLCLKIHASEVESSGVARGLLHVYIFSLQCVFQDWNKCLAGLSLHSINSYDSSDYCKCIYDANFP